MKILSLILLLTAAGWAGAQSSLPSPTPSPAVFTSPGPIKSSAAYAEVLLRKTDLESDLVSFADDYTDQNPKVVDTRFELSVLNKDIDRMFLVKPNEVEKLTEAVGKLILRHAELSTELNRLLRSYNEDHPQVKRARRKLDLYTRALKEVLG